LSWLIVIVILFMYIYMKVLELFSGTGSVSKICKELGWEVYSIDIDDKFYPVDKKINILEWDYKSLDFKPDIIWASPPCNSFSSMLFCSHTKEQQIDRIEKEGLPLMDKTLEIIDYFKPKYYFIENPKSGHMKEFIQGIPFIDVSYCMYGFQYRKHTRIWTNLEGFDAKVCNHKKHAFSISTTRGSNKKNINRLGQRYSIPPDLIRDLFNTI